jgi:hypothetical protein
MTTRTRPKPDLLQGTLDMMILKTLSLGANHGYGIARRIRQVSDDVLQVEEGSLYPALHRLEDRGTRVVNPPRAIERTVDKFWTSALLGSTPRCRSTPQSAISRCTSVTGRLTVPDIMPVSWDTPNWCSLTQVGATCCGDWLSSRRTRTGITPWIRLRLRKSCSSWATTLPRPMGTTGTDRPGGICAICLSSTRPALALCGLMAIA